MYVDDDQVITIEDGRKEIKNYLTCILGYLDSGVIQIKPDQYMKTYTCIVRLCDEYDKASDIYRIYLDILLDYVVKVSPKIMNKAGDSREFLKEYVN